MEYHYQKKHPGKRIPDQFYTGPVSYYGEHIPPYTGAYELGTKVRIVGFDAPMPDECPLCGKSRPGKKRMTTHYEKRHKREPLPRSTHHFNIEPTGREIEQIIQAGEQRILRKKGTVVGVIPAGYGGKRTLPIITVRLNKPIMLKYWDLEVIACYENELEVREEE